MPSELSRPRDASMPALVVGLGASAGGITALQQFFTRADPSVDAAYVVILHLSPDHDSRLAEVVQAVTPMPVTKVTEQVEILRAHEHRELIAPGDAEAGADECHLFGGFGRISKRIGEGGEFNGLAGFGQCDGGEILILQTRENIAAGVGDGAVAGLGIFKGRR